MSKIEPLNQDNPIGNASANHKAKVQRIFDSKRSILDALKDFAYSVPDFRRQDKGNIRYNLGDIIMLMILARMSKSVGRADIIAFGNHNLKKFQSMGMLKRGVPSEATLCRIDNGIDASGFAEKMAEFTQSFHEELIRRCRMVEMMLEIICVICVDGKALRGTVQENNRNPDIVSALVVVR